MSNRLSCSAAALEWPTQQYNPQISTNLRTALDKKFVNSEEVKRSQNLKKIRELEASQK